MSARFGSAGTEPEGEEPIPPPPRATERPVRILAQILEAPTASQVSAGPQPDSTAVPLALPETDFEPIRLLGRGAMGYVILARQRNLQRLVAVKLLRPSLTFRAALKRRSQAEAEAIARLQHPHIVQIYQVGETDGHPYLVLEYMDAGSLDITLARQPLSSAEGAELVAAIALAVQHGHHQGVIHRDLKPANILLRTRSASEPGTGSLPWIPKVSDFGLARIFQNEAATAGPTANLDATDTLVGQVLGTPSYMAPEQAAGRSDQVGPAADVYALGAILYECLTGKPPFRGGSVAETLAQVQSQDPVSVRSLRPGVPRDLETICLKCLAKDPSERYASPQAVAEDLGRFARGEPVHARPVGPLRISLKWARRRPLPAGLLLLAAALATGWWVAVLRHQQQLQHEIEQTRSARDRAEAHYRSALEAVRRLLDRVGQEHLAQIPEMEVVRNDILQDALAFYQQLARDTGNHEPDARWEVALARARVAMIEHHLGRDDQAASNYQRAIDALQALRDAHPRDQRFRDSLAEVSHDLAVMYLIRGDTGQVEVPLRRARELWLQATQTQPENTVYRMRVSDCDHQFGRFHDQRAAFNAAESAYLEALVARRALQKSDPDQTAYTDRLAMTLHNLANVYARTDRTDQAMQLESEAVQLFEQLSRARPDDERLLEHLSGGLHNLAIHHRTLGHPGESVVYHERALAIRELLALAHPRVPDYQNALAENLSQLGVHHLAQQAFENALPYTRRAVAITRRLWADDPDHRSYRNGLVNALNHHALTCGGLGQLTEAADAYAEAERTLDSSTIDDPADSPTRLLRASILINLGNLLCQQHRARDGVQRLTQAIELLTAIRDRVPDHADATLNLKMAHGARAQTFEGLKDYVKALRDWDRLIELESGVATRRLYRLLRCTTLARAGALSRLASEIDQLGSSTESNAQEFAHFGICCAIAARTLKDAGQASQLTQQAVGWLDRAHGQTPASEQARLIAEWQANPDLADLQQNPTFRQLIGKE